MTAVTGTPSTFPGPVAEDQVLEQVEFAAALEIVAGYAGGPLGAASVRGRRPAADHVWASGELAAVGEIAALIARDDRFDVAPVTDLAAVLEQLRVPGSVMDGPALLEIAGVVDVTQRVARELERIAEDAPHAARIRVVPPPMEPARAVTRALEPDGSVRDDASPELARARRRVRELRQRLIQLLEHMLRGMSGTDAGADASVTVRSGRYVIPVRAEARSKVGGIVHGESGSGATVFVEPAAAVEPANELREAEGAEARAVLAVLRNLTDQLRPHLDALHSGWLMCIAADDLLARSRYAVAVRAAVPELRPAPAPVRLRTAYHPVLLAEQPGAVPFDLDLAQDGRVLLISGPNTGGKTVLLKTAGLVAALAQSGVVPPVAAGTALAAFTRIFCDIGDHQSIAQSLSTFSAHLAALNDVVRHADSGSLVLLDELGSGTDPAEGAALASAILLHLVAQGGVAIATTHLSQLKQLAAETPGLRNASLEFDAKTLAPTYRLQIGVPGRSYALVIARRQGLPEELLRQAESLRPEGERTLDTLLADVEARSTDLTNREAHAKALEEALATRAAEVAVRLADADTKEGELNRKEREMEQAARQQARAFLLEARRTVEEALALARAAVDEATAKQARRLVEEGIRSEANALKDLEEKLEAKGWKVKGGGKGEKGEGRKEQGAGRGAQGAGTKPTQHAQARVAEQAVSEIDLRGMTGDEAELAVNVALDAAVLADLPALRIIHGKGTGALRERIRTLLVRDSRVGSQRLAPANQGGTGVTIAELKA